MSRYERVDPPHVQRFKHHWVVRDVKRGTLHVCWYDAATRQVGRRSLGTVDIEVAFTKVRSYEDRGIIGDPGELLDQALIETVEQLLDWHLPYTLKLASAEAEGIHIRRLKQHIGQRRIASLVQSDFEKFRDDLTGEGLSIGTVSRTLTTLRSALKRAAKDRLIKPDKVLFVPEFAKKNYWRSVQPKGRIMKLAELARLIDQIADLHLLIFVIFMLNTAARPGAILDMTGAQIDLSRGVLMLNPVGRIQTSKFRPALPITDTLLPWCENVPPGHLITWRGKPVTKIKSGFANAAKRAGLPGHEAAYSIRHMLGRHMRASGVSIEEIGVWLGHIQPPTSPETTLIYSPDSPDYLGEAKAAVEDFVGEINALTKHDLLLPPGRWS
ncbi:MAG: tyrosine-type recombinase/integrase [Pseudorhodoplanes sp.]|nr:tyrosine-type recombinase/integrase [Pseudorhodoplanes sp.]